MHRHRQNTEHELEIVSTVHNTRLRIGEPNIQVRIQDFLYKLIYNKYYWNGLTYMLFLILRLSSLQLEYTQISINEWYNDTLLFLISNNYFFKRIHWNNKNQGYYDTQYKYTIVRVDKVQVALYLLYY